MNISATKINSNFPTYKTVNSSFVRTKNEPLLSGVPENLKPVNSFYLPSFCSVNKLEKTVDYSNPKEFAAYFENKISAKLGVKDVRDIENIIASAVKETGFDEKTVTKTLARLTQFANYSQLPELSEQLNDNYCNYIATVGKTDVNSCLRYLSSNKGLLELRSNLLAENTGFLVLDSKTLDILENMKKKSPSSFKEKIKDNIRTGEIVPAIIDGWSATADGKDVSYTMFGAQNDIQTSLISVLNEMKKTGKTSDEVLNSNVIERFENLMGEETDVVTIKNPKTKKATASDIADFVNPISPKKDDIIALFDEVADLVASKNQPKHSKEKIMEYYAHYLDKMLNCYSVENLNGECRKKYQKLEKKVAELGKTMDDVVYLVPREMKSFDIVTHQFCKVNNISEDKIKMENGWQLRQDPEYNDKVCVILDDILGNGDTFLNLEFQYLLIARALNNPTCNDCNIIFAPICSLKSGIGNIEESIDDKERRGKDFLLTGKQVPDFNREMSNCPDEIKQVEASKPLGGAGYYDANCCTIFPFNVPDNNSDFSALFSTFFFPKENRRLLKKFERSWEYLSGMNTMIEKVQTKRNLLGIDNNF